MPSILVRDAQDITDAERAACQSLWRRTFAPNPAEQASRPPDPACDNTPTIYVMLRGDDDSLLGACNWIDREIEVAGTRHRIAGLAGVSIEEAHRGNGLGAQMIRGAIAAAAERGFDFGVLFCGPHRRAFYGRLGWRLLEGDLKVTRHGADGPPEEDNLVMALPLSPSAERQFTDWIHTPIHLGIGQW